MDQNGPPRIYRIADHAIYLQDSLSFLDAVSQVELMQLEEAILQGWRNYQ